MWTARRILKELADGEHRRRILTAFWRFADDGSRATAIVQLARAMHFRDETIRKMPPEKKGELLAGRSGAAEFEQTFETALMVYHTHEQRPMLAAFLDEWGVPHKNGSIEVDDYTPPSADGVRRAVAKLESRFDRLDIAIYLASAGLLMAGAWREATWPVADELAPAPRQP
jgi:hypothetical protein